MVSVETLGEGLKKGTGLGDPGDMSFRALLHHFLTPGLHDSHIRNHHHPDTVPPHPEGPGCWGREWGPDPEITPHPWAGSSWPLPCQVEQFEPIHSCPTFAETHAESLLWKGQK